MTIIKRSENFPMFPALLDDFFGRDWFDYSMKNFSKTNTTVPSVNIVEGEDNFEIEMAAPGFEKKDFKVELNHNVLTISSDKSESKDEKDGKNFSRREFSYQSFCRSFTIPNVVDSEKIEARYENGILKVLIPKRDELKPKPLKEIEIL